MRHIFINPQQRSIENRIESVNRSDRHQTEKTKEPFLFQEMLLTNIETNL